MAVNEGKQLKYFQLMEDLKEKILSGEIQAGDKLPSENELSKEYAISRQTVRKALQILQNMGYIYAEHGRGTFCSELVRHTHTSKNIAVVTTYLSDYIFPRVIAGIDSVLTAQGYSIILKNTRNSRSMEAKCLEELLQKDIDGVIIEPSKSQISDVLVFAGACRFVYNKGLALLSENYNNGKPFLNYNKLAPLLVEWKSDHKFEWLKLCPSQCLQQSLRDLDRAFQNFFSGRALYPRFKKKGRSDSFRVPCQRVRLDQEKGLVSLPKLGWVKYRKSREVTGNLKNVTISKKLDKWYISFNTEEFVSEPVHPSINKTKVLLNDGYVTLCSRNVRSVAKIPPPASPG